MKTPPLIALGRGSDVNRRDMLKLLGAGIGALTTGCISRAGDEDIVPQLAEPPEHRPGSVRNYTGLVVVDGFATGTIAQTHDGRPTKLDGNSAHPASLGGSSPWLQARILDLYDPQRATTARLDGSPVTWNDLATRLRTLPRGPLWLVMPPQSSPTVQRLLDRIRERHDLHVVSAGAQPNRYRGAALAFGQPLEVQYDLEQADVVLSLDADFMAGMPMSPAWSRAAARRRAPGRMSRIWACEPMETPTGTFADERLAIRAADIACVAVQIVAELGRRGLAVPPLPDDVRALAMTRLGRAATWASAVAAELAGSRGAVFVGDRQPPVIHALARWIDHACKSAAVTLTAPAIIDPVADASLADLAAAAHRGQVASVVVIDEDPVYTAPRSLALGTALPLVPFSLHVGAHANHTTAVCKAHVPLAHELETWTDGRAWDGTLAIGQPLVRPRFDVASTIDVLAALAGDSRDARAWVREQIGGSEVAWTSALRTGVVAGTNASPVAAVHRWSPAATAELTRTLVATAPRPAAFEIALAASPLVGDGRFASNAWLQELPHPITKQTWGNAALMNARTASALGVSDEDLVDLATEAGHLIVPVLVTPGAADGSITLELGYGQRVPAIPIANEVGANAYALRSDDRCILQGTVRRATGTRRVIRTQTVMAEHGRDVAPAATIAQLQANPDVVAHLRGEQASLLPAQDRSGVQWGMSIDTSICTGCSSCMVACQAENNISTVGPDDVARGRHMNWIRIDRYVHDDGVVVNEPMPCQHCENAPCEYVCPVNATTHSPDGLNEQVYNRCVGTRFCSNNCPYKVRRFNWFAYEKSDERALQYNPDVTVRTRGVMEKCTYCVQRIRRAEQRAIVEDRELGPREVVTACQQACPTGAIQFGQLHETGTAFAAARRDPRRFDVLHDLGTRPRTQYLAKIRNPRGGV